MTGPVGEEARRVVATGALSWIGAGFLGRRSPAPRREGTDSAVKRTRHAREGLPEGFGSEHGAVAPGDSLSGRDPAFEKRLRKW